METLSPAKSKEAQFKKKIIKKKDKQHSAVMKVTKSSISLLAFLLNVVYQCKDRSIYGQRS